MEGRSRFTGCAPAPRASGHPLESSCGPVDSGLNTRLQCAVASAVGKHGWGAAAALLKTASVRVRLLVLAFSWSWCC